MSEKRRALGRGLGALIPSSPGTARPVDVFFRESAPPPPPDDADPSGDSAEQLNGHGHDTSRGDALTERPVHDEPSSGAGNGVEDGTEGGYLHGRTSPGQPGEREDRALNGALDAGSDDDHRPSGDPVESDGSGDATVGGAPELGLAPVPGATFAVLPIAAIRPNPRQPRTVFDEDELAELAASIREIGVLQPVVVRPIARAERESADLAPGEPHDGVRLEGGSQDEAADVGPRFELIMGERRLRASQLAGQDTIPAIVKETHDDDLLRDALLENLHRTQLNPLEEAAAYQQLLDDFGCSHDELASRIGRSRPQISNTIRLLRLPPLVARRLAAGVLSAGHARALLGLDEAAAMERLAQRIVAEGLSVRSVEEIVALGGDDPAAVPKARRPRAGTRHPQLDDLAARLSDRYDTRVTIALGQRKGRLTVEFASVEDLNRIVELMEQI
ncbi:MAG TPA: ParB/RepB/Spo0J family partition protein [Lapillicoccus sp.]